MRAARTCILVAALLLPAFAGAEVKLATAEGAIIEHRFRIAATPDAAWQVLVHPERYWPKDHTWSGDAANLSLAPEAGGCFCERWAGGSAEHGRIVMAKPGQLLRLRGSLGPFQEMAVTGVLTVTLAAVDAGTEAVVTYRLSGDASHEFAGFIATVDEVIGLQFGGFAKLASAATARQAPPPRAIQSSTSPSSTVSGTAPFSSTTAWKSLRSNFGPSAVRALSRNARILSWPTL